MCGLAGIFTPRGCRAEAPNLDAMLRIMRHRGPDGQNTWARPDGLFQAGFVRLAIIDLQTGDQPIVEDGGARVLLGNGEIYNYQELRREEPDYPFKTDGDMETVLATSRHGERFVDRLNGMFALALYERDVHRLLLVRDRLGVKPMYWAQTPGGSILFASEIKALFASGLVAPEIDEAAVSAYLGHGFVPGPATLFKGIKKLMPSHAMEIDATGNIRHQRYWRPQAPDDMPADSPGIEAYLTELLSDSVRLQLRSDVPVGALLSGGLDSGLMVALAATHSGRPLNTFTVSFEGADYDEAPLARAVAERYATTHREIRIDATAITEHLPRLIWHGEEPLFDAALLPNFLIEEALSEHVTVALNGTGGDELFAGYGRYFKLPVERRYLSLPRWLRNSVIEPLAGLASPMTAFQLCRASRYETDRGGYLHEHTGHFPAPLRDLIGNAMQIPAASQRQAFEEFNGETDSRALYADMATYLPDDLLTLLDRTSMAASVEGRVPLLDHRIVDAALAVPTAIRTPGGRQKALQRKIAGKYLPDAVLTAPKQGFRSPVPNWIAGEFGALAKQMLTRPAALERGWWTRAGIERLFADPARHGFRIYTLTTLEMTVRQFVETPLTQVAPEAGMAAYV